MIVVERTDERASEKINSVSRGEPRLNVLSSTIFQEEGSIECSSLLTCKKKFFEDVPRLSTGTLHRKRKVTRIYHVRRNLARLQRSMRNGTHAEPIDALF